MQLSSISLAITRLVGGLYTPRALFLAGEPGAWYDPSDLTTLYQNAAGTVPVTAVEQPVGLVLDKSKGLVLGSNTSTGVWINTYTTAFDSFASSSSAEFTASTAGAKTGIRVGVPCTLSIGKSYQIEFTVTLTNALVSSVLFGTSTLSGTSTVQTPTTITSGVSYRVLGTVTAISSTVMLVINTSGVATVALTGFQARELPGNHATNPSGNSANFPVLSARYNLLAKTEQFDDASWVKEIGSITSTNALAPNGTYTASIFTETSANGVHGARNSVALSGAIGYEIIGAVHLKRGTRRYGFLSVYNGQTYDSVVVDLDTAEVTATSAPELKFVVKPVANGFVFIQLSRQQVGTNNSYVYWGPASSSTPTFTSGRPSYTSVGGDTIIVWGADLRVANDALNQPKYQRVNTATDYDTAGFKPYLRFNGVNQWLQTNSIDFSSTDKMFVCAGVRKLSDAAFGLLLEISNSIRANNGSLVLFVPREVTGTKEFATKGTAIGSATTAAVYPAPVTSVLGGIGNISGDQSILRVNGTQAAISAADQGTGNYGNYPLYSGARAGTSLFFNGRLYGMVIAGKQASAAEIANTESFLNQRTGAY